MIWNLEEHIVKKIKKPLMYFWLFCTACIFIIMFTPVANLMASVLIVESDIKKSDVIAVLGSGVYKNGVLTSSTSERLIHGLLLFKGGYSEKLFFTGATIKELNKKIASATNRGSIDDNLTTYDEGGSMFSVVYSMGIPPESIAYDDKATHTYSNMVELKKYMGINKLSSCLIVTSPTHMYRSMLSAKKVGLECSPAPVEDYTGDITNSIGRINLFHQVLWEYAGLVFYKLYDYI